MKGSREKVENSSKCMRLYDDFHDVLKEVSVTFDPEVDLSDDAIGRSRYEWFYSVRSNYAKSLKMFARAQLRVPLKELSRVKLGRLSWF